MFVYLPRSLLAEKYAACCNERLTRLAIYGTAIAIVFGLRHYNDHMRKAAPPASSSRSKAIGRAPATILNVWNSWYLASWPPSRAPGLA